MRHILFIFSVFLFSLTLISCRDTSKTATTDNETTNNELIGNNNNSILSGSRIGSGEYYNSYLSKSLRISVNSSVGFSYTTAYVGKNYIYQYFDDDPFRWIIPITNLS